MKSLFTSITEVRQSVQSKMVNMPTHCASRGCGTTLLLLLMCVVAIRAQCAPQPNLSGTVVDPSGALIANAHVDLYGEKHEWHTTTDKAGRFSFPAPGMYDVEVTSQGFRKKIIENVRIDSSEPAPMTITMQVASTADSCGDSLSRVTYVDATGESGIKGVVTLDSHPGEIENGGQKRVADSAGLLSGITISVLKSGSRGKPLTVRPNENSEFDFAGLEPGLYLLRASLKGYADFAVSNVRVRPGKTLQVRFSMWPSGYIEICM